MPWRSASCASFPTPIPSSSGAALQLADGFEVNLYAADPLLAKPIHMNFDARGRLWVASSEVYPHIKPGQNGQRQDPGARRCRRRRPRRKDHGLCRRAC